MGISVVLGVVALLGTLLSLVAAAVAIASPQFRLAAGLVAGLGLTMTAGMVGLFVVIVSSMG